MPITIPYTESDSRATYWSLSLRQSCAETAFLVLSAQYFIRFAKYTHDMAWLTYNTRLVKCENCELPGIASRCLPTTLDKYSVSHSPRPVARLRCVWNGDKTNYMLHTYMS
jgi:hypothetical protein